MKYKFAYVDKGSYTIVIACKACPHWSAIQLDPIAALRTKADHDNRVHGVEPARAGHAEIEYRKRSGVSESIE